MVDNARVAAETKVYKKIPDIVSFIDENGNDTMKKDIENIVNSEMNRIEDDPELKH